MPTGYRPALSDREFLMYFTLPFLRLKGLQVTTPKEMIKLNNNPKKFKEIQDFPGGHQPIFL